MAGCWGTIPPRPANRSCRHGRLRGSTPELGLRGRATADLRLRPSIWHQQGLGPKLGMLDQAGLGHVAAVKAIFDPDRIGVRPGKDPKRGIDDGSLRRADAFDRTATVLARLRDIDRRIDTIAPDRPADILETSGVTFPVRSVLRIGFP